MTRILIAFAFTLLAASPAYSQLFCDADERVRLIEPPTYDTQYRLSAFRLDYLVFKISVTPNQAGAEFLLRLRRNHLSFPATPVATIGTDSSNRVTLDGVAMGTSGQTVVLTIQETINRTAQEVLRVQLLLNTAGATVNSLDVLGEFGEDIEGDFDGSGLVEQGDMDLVLNGWGEGNVNLPIAWMRGHLPADGRCDQNELDAVLNNWGGTCD